VSVSIRGEKIEVQTLNISLAGMLCMADGHFHKAEQCQVVIKLDPDIQITVQGKIIRTSPDETAIAFLSMDEESFLHLKKLVEFNAEDADKIDKELHTPAFG
jgi:hypothetical protein